MYGAGERGPVSGPDAGAPGILFARQEVPPSRQIAGYWRGPGVPGRRENELMFIFARLVAIFLLIAVALPAAAAEQVRVDIGRHPGFTRLVFTWTNQTGYTISRDGRNARIQFEKPGEIDITRMDAVLPKPEFGSPVASMAGGDLALDLTIPETAFLRHFRTDTKIVVDILEEGGDFGGAVAAENGAAPIMQTISPTGEILTIPAMVGTRVAVAPQQGVPLITEEDVADADGPATTAAVPRVGYDPLTHYDPSATGRPRTLLLYDRNVRTGKPEGG